MLLFHRIPPFSPVLVAPVILCAICGLKWISPLEAWSFVLYSTKTVVFWEPAHLPWWRLTKLLIFAYAHCVPTASSVADSSHKLILCDAFMSMQWEYGAILSVGGSVDFVIGWPRLMLCCPFVSAPKGFCRGSFVPRSHRKQAFCFDIS